jgi:hypothetical protein
MNYSKNPSPIREREKTSEKGKILLNNRTILH